MKAQSSKKTDAIIAEADLATFCPDLSTWARSWRCEERDIVPGDKLVALFKPFLLHLLGDIIETPRIRKRPVEELLREAIADGQGPLLHGGVRRPYPDHGRTPRWVSRHSYA